MMTMDNFKGHILPLFVYGTLQYRPILIRVLPEDDHLSLEFHSGTLRGFKRHRVHGEAYPAIAAEDGEVQGTVIWGLSQRDMGFLDEYEGDEYEKKEVKVIISGNEVECFTYVWIDDVERLSDEDWVMATDAMEAFLREIEIEIEIEKEQRI